MKGPQSLDTGAYNTASMATRRKKQVVSAQVVLRSASGKPSREATITAANIQDFLPSPETTARATQAIAAAGFEVTPVYGNSFSITAPIATFEQFFQTRLRVGQRGDVQAMSGREKASYELPLEAIPSAMKGLIDAVTFTPPPEFGPTGQGP